MTDTHPTGTGPDAAGLAHDYLDLDSLFSAEELALRDRVRAFVSERIRPNIAAWYEAGHFPREIVKARRITGTCRRGARPLCRPLRARRATRRDRGSNPGIRTAPAGSRR